MQCSACNKQFTELLFLLVKGPSAATINTVHSRIPTVASVLNYSRRKSFEPGCGGTIEIPARPVILEWHELAGHANLDAFALGIGLAPDGLLALAQPRNLKRDFIVHIVTFIPGCRAFGLGWPRPSNSNRRIGRWQFSSRIISDLGISDRADDVSDQFVRHLNGRPYSARCTSKSNSEKRDG